MEQDTLKLTGVLSDPTRFYIYQFISQKKDYVTVQEIAQQFAIHPNVARLHLSKLEDVQLLQSTSEKTGKGGRPSRLYKLSQQVVQLQFPPRDFQFLSEVSLRSITKLGDIGKQTFLETGKETGVEIAKRFEQLHGTVENLNISEKVEYFQKVLEQLGLNPEIYALDEHSIRFKLYNCTFKETATKYPELVCQLHHALIEGILTYFFAQINIKEDANILQGCMSCDYIMTNL